MKTEQGRVIMKLFVIVLLASFNSIVSSTDAATYYVSTVANASNANTGTRRDVVFFPKPALTAEILPFSTSVCIQVNAAEATALAHSTPGVYLVRVTISSGEKIMCKTVVVR